MSRRWLIVVGFIGLFALIGGGFWLFSRDESSNSSSIQSSQVNKTVVDKQLGVSFSIPATYQSRADTPAQLGQKDPKPAKNFMQVSPQGLFTVRTESGLALAANATKQSLIDYMQNSVIQFFPSRYKDYKSISLVRTKVAGYDSIEHVYSYTDQDGHKVIARIVIVPYGNDSAYYLILQASESNYDSVKNDLDIIKNSFKIL